MQRAKHQLVTDLFLVVQVVAALLSGIVQFERLLTSTQGVNISWYVFWDAFVVINLGLALRAHKVQPSRLTRQTVATYIVWLLMVTSEIVAMAWGRSGVWDVHDTQTTVIAGIGILLTALAARAKGLSLLDPYARGALALCFRAVPQCMVAYTLATEGNGGFPLLSVVMGHVAILTRIGQVGYSIREAGWDRNRIGSAIAEIGNELSWIAITVGWLMA